MERPKSFMVAWLGPDWSSVFFSWRRWDSQLISGLDMDRKPPLRMYTRTFGAKVNSQRTSVRMDLPWWFLAMRTQGGGLNEPREQESTPETHQYIGWVNGYRRYRRVWVCRPDLRLVQLVPG